MPFGYILRFSLQAGSGSIFQCPNGSKPGFALHNCSIALQNTLRALPDPYNSAPALCCTDPSTPVIRVTYNLDLTQRLAINVDFDTDASHFPPCS